ncbi:MAG: permease-like cell division protein FtsX [Firmicutes bacterium]|jgi:cell division transport system permease protein|nr:permease-like cell division protein FtsX [Bacillota bacterium]
MGIASISTVGLCLVCLAAFYLVSANIRHVATILESQVEIRVFLVEGLESKRVEDIRETIAGYKDVLSVRYVSKDDALRRLRQQLGQYSDLLADIEEANPLPASFEVSMKSPEKVGDVAEDIARLSGVESVSYKRELVYRLLLVTRVFRVTGTFLVAALAVATVVLVSNTIRLTLFARRHEIAIMKLVGATDSFIRAPFVLEGLILGFVGAGLASLVTRAAYSWVTVNVPKAVPFLPVLPGSPLLDRLTAILLLSGTAMGAFGSALSLRRYTQV